MQNNLSDVRDQARNEQIWVKGLVRTWVGCVVRMQAHENPAMQASRQHTHHYLPQYQGDNHTHCSAAIRWAKALNGSELRGSKAVHVKKLLALRDSLLM